MTMIANKLESRGLSNCPVQRFQIVVLYEFPTVFNLLNFNIY